MKARFLSGMIALLACVSIAMAEDVAPSVSVGSKAMLFTFSGLANLGASSYQNGLATAGAGGFTGGIGGKYFLTSAIGMRLGLQFGMANQNVKTSLATGGSDGYNSASLFGISIGGEYHLNLNKVSPYAGVQVAYTAGSTEVLDPINVANGPKVTHYNTAAVFGFAPGSSLIPALLGGVEFFITKEVSLSAEYQLAYKMTMDYDSKTTTVTGTGSTDVKTTVPGMSTFGFTNNGLVTLAVYF